MFIQDYMTTSPITASSDTPIATAREIINSNKFRHLPITDTDGKLIGMVTDRDLRSAFPSTVLTEEEKQACIAMISEKSVNAIMSKKFSALSADSTLDDALFLLDRDKVGALPVLDEEGRVIGIFSIRDLIKAYKELYGLGEMGSSLVVIEDDGQQNPLTKIVRALEEHSINFTRLVKPLYKNDTNGKGMIYLRVNTFNLSAVHTTLEKAGFSVVTPKIKTR